ncbi:MAG: GIDE domain-containing protein [Thermostichales cyanobacterium BF4_bins_65]
MWVVGLLLLLTGAGLGIGYRVQRRRLGALLQADQNTLATVQSIAQDLGTLNYVTGIRGEVVCDQPLTSQLAQEKCVYYQMTVTRQYEETRWETDADGRRNPKTERGSRVETQHQRHVPFLLRDSSGTLHVRPDGAEFIGETFLSRFEPANQPSLRVGGFNLQVAGHPTGGQRTLGYQLEEKGIPVGREVFVLGEVINEEGRLLMRRPGQGRFVISLKPVEELIRGGQAAAQGLLWGAVGSGGLGLVLLIVGLV